MGELLALAEWTPDLIVTREQLMMNCLEYKQKVAECMGIPIWNILTGELRDFAMSILKNQANEERQH